MGKTNLHIYSQPILVPLCPLLDTREYFGRRKNKLTAKLQAFDKIIPGSSFCIKSHLSCSTLPALFVPFIRNILHFIGGHSEWYLDLVCWREIGWLDSGCYSLDRNYNIYCTGSMRRFPTKCRYTHKLPLPWVGSKVIFYAYHLAP